MKATGNESHLHFVSRFWSRSLVDLLCNAPGASSPHSLFLGLWGSVLGVSLGLCAELCFSWKLRGEVGDY